MMNRFIQLGLCAFALTLPMQEVDAASSARETPVVRAIRRVETAVANIHSEKTADDSGGLFSIERNRKINGMGTGIIIDERGYIVTNHHVVDGVDSLRVTLRDGSAYTAQIVSYDRKHDLAIIKINASRPLDVMPLGTSSDLMLGETVIAVGNAYGYENSMTGGLISQLSRDVDVNEKQSYKNLIQTDASINPGNSGGPLINLDGEVIGINVAIRAGAQRIGFAIPIDDARKIIAQLLSVEKLSHTWHGVVGTDIKSGSLRQFVIDQTVASSPGAQAGLQPGDIVVKAGGLDVIDAADFERACLGKKPGEVIPVVVKRGEETADVTMTLTHVSGRQSFGTIVRANNSDNNGANDRFWQMFGMRLGKLANSKGSLSGSRYRGGMRVTSVRANGPAALNGIQEGDVLVGLHVWETVSFENVSYVADHPQLKSFSPLKFYVLRGEETLWGHLPVTAQ
jgi:serine protease Do